MVKWICFCEFYSSYSFIFPGEKGIIKKVLNHLITHDSTIYRNIFFFRLRKPKWIKDGNLSLFWCQNVSKANLRHVWWCDRIFLPCILFYSILDKIKTNEKKWRNSFVNMNSCCQSLSFIYLLLRRCLID